jgi:hypothetical protein
MESLRADGKKRLDEVARHSAPRLADRAMS